MNNTATQTPPATVPGLTSIRLVIDPAEESNYRLVRDRLAVDLQPMNQLEYNLFNQLVAAQWQLMHLAAQESHLLAVFPDIYAEEENHAILDRLLRHRQRLEVTQAKALKELRSLQAERRKREKAQAEAPAEAPALAVVHTPIRPAKATPTAPPIPINARRLRLVEPAAPQPEGSGADGGEDPLPDLTA